MKHALFSLSLAAGMIAPAAAHASQFNVCSISGCAAGGSASVYSSYGRTRYPVILAHGASGFSQIGGVDYFFRVPQSLTASGAKVFITQVASLNSNETRGEQLLEQVQIVQAITGAPKVNLIGHSQGTLDSRYVAAVAPQRVASVTGVGGPNTGSPVADVLMGATEVPVVGALGAMVVETIANAFFALVDVASGQAYEQDAIADLSQFTAAKSAAFNAAYPAGLPEASNPCGQGAATVNGIRFYSWGGTGIMTTGVDPSDALLAATGLAFGGQPNDGVVGRCSSHLGVVIRDNYNMNHLDQVNQIFGLTSLFESDPVSLFRSHANRLKLAGL